MKYLRGYNVSVAFVNVNAGDAGTNNKSHKHLGPRTHMRRTIPNRNKNAYDQAVICGNVVYPNVMELRSLSKKHGAIHMDDYDYDDTFEDMFDDMCSYGCIYGVGSPSRFFGGKHVIIGYDKEYQSSLLEEDTEYQSSSLEEDAEYKAWLEGEGSDHLFYSCPSPVLLEWPRLCNLI